MKLIAIFAFFYFLYSENRSLTKKFFRSCNIMLFMVAIVSLTIDFALRMFAFNSIYCRNMTPEGQAECQAVYQNNTWTDVFKILIYLRVVYYSCEMLQKYSDTHETKDIEHLTNSLL